MHCGCLGTNVFEWNTEIEIERYNQIFYQHYEKDNNRFLLKHQDITTPTVKREAKYTLHFIEMVTNQVFFPREINKEDRINDEYIEEGTYPYSYTEETMKYFLVEKEVDLNGDRILCFGQYEVINDVSRKIYELIFTNGVLNGAYTKQNHLGIMYEMVTILNGCKHGLVYERDETNGKLLRISGYIHGHHCGKEIIYDNDEKIIAVKII